VAQERVQQLGPAAPVAVPVAAISRLVSPAWMAVFLCAALAAGIVLSTPVSSWRTQADEGYYLIYATRIAEHGPSAFPDLFREYLEDPLSREYFPSPIRLTAICLGALAVRLGGPTFSSLAHLSLASFLVLLVLVFAGARRAFGERTALCTVLLLSVSPLHLGMARRALSDSLNATLLVAGLGFCVHLLTAERPGRRGWWALAALYTVAFLGRELNLVLIPLSLTLIGAHAIRHRCLPPLRTVACVTVLPGLAAIACAALAAGGFSPAWRAFAGTVLQPATNTYALAYGAGPWFRYLVDGVLLSPWPPLLFLAWLGYLLGARVSDERAWTWALVPVLFIACAVPFPKFVRWALALEAPVRLGAVLLLERLLARAAGRRASACLGAAVALLMLVDLAGFRRLFVVSDIYDPTTTLLAASRDLIPR
jgi:4-amino-4-deoxy-L-arabinose transferase-like glycosyltransferase